MSKKQWYESLFENYAETYDKEVFTQGTIRECDFLAKEFPNKDDFKILDVGCGTGRHAIEMTKRGYDITGIDLSQNQIEHAKAKAVDAGLNIEFLRMDARNIEFKNEFDAAIMLCEGGFPLMETDEMNFEILKNVSEALKSKCKLIFTTLNGLFPLFNNIEKFCAGMNQPGNAEYKKNRFDLMTFRDHNTTEFIDDSGKKVTLESNERFYVPSEITWLLKTLDFTKIDIYAGKFGDYSREEKLTPDHFEMLVIAER